MVSCTVFDSSCPHLLANGKCELENPRVDCDDYYAMIGDEDEDDEE